MSGNLDSKFPIAGPEYSNHHRDHVKQERSQKSNSNTFTCFQRNKIGNTSFFLMSAGFLISLVVALSVLFDLHANDSADNNLRAAVVIITAATCVWIVTGSPWFFLEEQRAPRLPDRETYLTAGIRAYWHAFKRIPKLTQI